MATAPAPKAPPVPAPALAAQIDEYRDETMRLLYAARRRKAALTAEAEAAVAEAKAALKAQKKASEEIDRILDDREVGLREVMKGRQQSIPFRGVLPTAGDLVPRAALGLVDPEMRARRETPPPPGVPSEANPCDAPVSRLIELGLPRDVSNRLVAAGVTTLAQLGGHDDFAPLSALPGIEEDDAAKVAGPLARYRHLHPAQPKAVEATEEHDATRVRAGADAPPAAWRGRPVDEIGLPLEWVAWAVGHGAKTAGALDDFLRTDARPEPPRDGLELMIAALDAAAWPHRKCLRCLVVRGAGDRCPRCGDTGWSATDDECHAPEDDEDGGAPAPPAAVHRECNRCMFVRAAGDACPRCGHDAWRATLDDPDVLDEAAAAAWQATSGTRAANAAQVPAAGHCPDCGGMLDRPYGARKPNSKTACHFDARGKLCRMEGGTPEEMHGLRQRTGPGATDAGVEPPLRERRIYVLDAPAHVLEKITEKAKLATIGDFEGFCRSSHRQRSSVADGGIADSIAAAAGVSKQDAQKVWDAFTGYMIEADAEHSALDIYGQGKREPAPAGTPRSFGASHSPPRAKAAPDPTPLLPPGTKFLVRRRGSDKVKCVIVAHSLAEAYAHAQTLPGTRLAVRAAEPGEDLGIFAGVEVHDLTGGAK
jgi:hypothetical protein